MSLAAEKEKDAPFFISLIRLYLKPTTLYFAICDSDIYFNGQNYLAFPVEIGTKKQTVDSKIDNLELTISNVNDEFSSALFNGYDFRGRRIEIITIVYPESLTDATQFDYNFVADLDSPSLDCAKGIFKVTCKAGIPNISTGRTAMLSCQALEFGDSETCSATKVTSTGTVQDGSTGNSIVIQQTQADGYWVYGHLTIGYETRKITGNIGSVVTVDIPFFVAPSGTYEITTGCNKSAGDCKRHNNMQNYSGILGIPWETKIVT